MKRIIVLGIILLFAHTSYAGQWCQWDEVSGVNCQSDSRGFIRTPFKTSTESIANDKGWFKVVVTQPTIGADQVRDAEVWSFADNEIGLTWTVRDLSAQEIQDRDDQIAAREGLISRELYYFINCLMTNGSIDLVNGKLNPAPCSQALKDAYQARGRLEAQ